MGKSVWIDSKGREFLDDEGDEMNAHTINQGGYYFTFMFDSPLGGYAVFIKGNYEEARKKMVEIFGSKWVFQYEAKEFEKGGRLKEVLLEDLSNAINEKWEGWVL